MRQKRRQFHPDSQRDGISLPQLLSGRWQARTWDRTLGKYQANTFDAEGEAFAHGRTKVAKFHLGQDNAAVCNLDAVWTGCKAKRMESGRAKHAAINSI